MNFITGGSKNGTGHLLKEEGGSDEKNVKFFYDRYSLVTSKEEMFMVIVLVRVFSKNKRRT